MFDFLKSLFNPAPPSGNTAKERLRLVLLSDHLSLAPDVVEALKKDLLAVISRYVTIDSAHADVTFEHRENEVAMLANIPITGVRERSAAERAALAPPAAQVPQASAPVAIAEHVTIPAGDEPVQATPAPAKSATRRRRRKKSPAALAAAAERSAANQPQPGYSAQA